MIVETHELTKRYGDRDVVSDLELAVPEASVYGFLGPNGAGKTTTIRMLLGLISPSRGSVLLFGRPLRDMRNQILGQVGSLVEGPSAYPNLSGRENLRVLVVLLGLKSGRMDDVLRLMGLESDQHRLVREYSLGMKQRLGIAMALLHEPNLLILDEPTNGLDPQGIREMRHLIRDLPGQLGVTVFLSSHLLDEVELIATHVGILQQGHLVFQDRMSAVREQAGGRLALRVSEPDRARAILQSQLVASFEGESGEDGSALRVRASSDQEVAEIARQLVSANIEVYAMVPERPRLEDLFFGYTRGAER